MTAAVSKNLALFPELMKGWWSEDALVRMRAADATEKITRNNPHLLRPYRREILGLMAEAKQQELRSAFRGCGAETSVGLERANARVLVAVRLRGTPQLYRKNICSSSTDRLGCGRPNYPI